MWPTPQEPNGAGGYVSHLFTGTPKKNLRIYLNVGTKDLGAGKNGAWDWVLANTTAANQLAAQGYHHLIYLSKGGNHVDQCVIDATLPVALAWGMERLRSISNSLKTNTSRNVFVWDRPRQRISP